MDKEYSIISERYAIHETMIRAVFCPCDFPFLWNKAFLDPGPLASCWDESQMLSSFTGIWRETGPQKMTQEHLSDVPIPSCHSWWRMGCQQGHRSM